jgi:hypothetical protein
LGGNQNWLHRPKLLFFTKFLEIEEFSTAAMMSSFYLDSSYSMHNSPGISCTSDIVSGYSEI